MAESDDLLRKEPLVTAPPQTVSPESSSESYRAGGYMAYSVQHHARDLYQPADIRGNGALPYENESCASPCSANGMSSGMPTTFASGSSSPAPFVKAEDVDSSKKFSLACDEDVDSSSSKRGADDPLTETNISKKPYIPVVPQYPHPPQHAVATEGSEAAPTQKSKKQSKRKEGSMVPLWKGNVAYLPKTFPTEAGDIQSESNDTETKISSLVTTWRDSAQSPTEASQEPSSQKPSWCVHAGESGEKYKKEKRSKTRPPKKPVETNWEKVDDVISNVASGIFDDSIPDQLLRTASTHSPTADRFQKSPDMSDTTEKGSASTVSKAQKSTLIPTWSGNMQHATSLDGMGDRLVTPPAAVTPPLLPQMEKYGATNLQSTDMDGSATADSQIKTSPPSPSLPSCTSPVSDCRRTHSPADKSLPESPAASPQTNGTADAHGGSMVPRWRVAGSDKDEDSQQDKLDTQTDDSTGMEKDGSNSKDNDDNLASMLEDLADMQEDTETSLENLGVEMAPILDFSNSEPEDSEQEMSSDIPVWRPGAHTENSEETRDSDHSEDEDSDKDGGDEAKQDSDESTDKTSTGRRKKRKPKKRSRDKNTEEKDGDDGPKKKKNKSQFERKNIREIKADSALDETTLAAQQEEKERQKRLAEWREKLMAVQAQALEKAQKLATPAQLVAAAKNTRLQNGQLKSLLDADDVPKARAPRLIIVHKKPKPKDEDVVEISSDDDDKKEDDEGEDVNNCGQHTNDTLNQLDEEGRVLVNVAHPDTEPDIYLAPQLARAVKPHQVRYSHHDESKYKLCKVDRPVTSGALQSP